MRWRQRRRQDEASPQPTVDVRDVALAEQPAVDVRDVALAETVARHFDDANVAGRTVSVPEIGLQIECSVFHTQVAGAITTAHLQLVIAGNALGPRPVRLTVSGYGDSVDSAIVEGGCQWSCAFGPVLRVAFGASQPDAEVGVVERALRGRRTRVVIGRLDRGVAFDGRGGDTAEARHRHDADPWLTTSVLDSVAMPVLPHAATVMSLFVGEFSGQQTVELCLNGGNWPAFGRFDDADLPSAGIVLLRELAVLVPLDPRPPLDRGDLEATFASFSELVSPRQAGAWLGWSAHGGSLGAPMSAAELDDLEATAGPLPPDYRRFLAAVACSGAGPGYGLVRPVVDDRHITLAEAGCNVRWRMRLDSEHRGTVWVDAPGSDRRYEQVAGSFDEWYGDWLDAAVRGDLPWVQWDPSYCATASVFARVLDDRERATGSRPPDLVAIVPSNSITLSFENAGGSIPGDPCEACVALAAHYGLAPDVFVPGVLRHPDAT